MRSNETHFVSLQGDIPYDSPANFYIIISHRYIIETIFQGTMRYLGYENGAPYDKANASLRHRRMRRAVGAGLRRL